MKNTKTKCLTLSGIVFLFFTACTQPVQVGYYNFDLQKPLEIDQLVFRSSAIVVGTVKSVRTGREGVPARKVPELLLDGCLARLEGNAAVPASLHAELAEMKVARVDWNARLQQRLRSFPMFAFEMSPFSDSIEGVRQELVMLVDDPDPELKTLACAILRQNYPNSPDACR